MTDDDPRPSPAELLLQAIDALPADDRSRVLLWLIGPTPYTPRGMLMMRSYAQAVAARLLELRPLTREYVLSFGADVPAADEVDELLLRPIRLTRSQHSRLHQWCGQHNFTMATVVRGLVDRFLEGQAASRPTPNADDPPDNAESA